MTPAQFIAACTALNGPSWQRPSAKLLGLSERYVRFMAAGERPIAAATRAKLLAALKQHAAHCTALRRSL